VPFTRWEERGRIAVDIDGTAQKHRVRWSEFYPCIRKSKEVKAMGLFLISPNFTRATGYFPFLFYQRMTTYLIRFCGQEISRFSGKSHVFFSAKYASSKTRNA